MKLTQSELRDQEMAILRQQISSGQKQLNIYRSDLANWELERQKRKKEIINTNLAAERRERRRLQRNGLTISSSRQLLHPAVKNMADYQQACTEIEWISERIKDLKLELPHLQARYSLFASMKNC